MDQQQILSFPVLFSFLLFIFILLKILKKNNNPNRPPGPWKLPIIGNIHQLVGDTPHRRLTELAKIYGPIMEIKLGQVPFLVFSSPEIAKEVLKTQDAIFADRPLFLAAEFEIYYIVFAPYGDEWRQMRKFCTLELLSAKRVQSFKYIREEEVAQLVKLLKSRAGSPVNLRRTLAALTNSIITRNSIGKKLKKQDDLIRLIDDINLRANGFSIVDIFPSLKWLHSIIGGRKIMFKLRKDTNEILEEILVEHRAKRQEAAKKGIKIESDNLLDVLLDFQQSGNLDVPLTDVAIKATIIEIFGAGSETISKSTEWAMIELMKNPDAMKKAQQELRSFFGENGSVDEARLNEVQYLKLVIKETLRLHPPGAMIPRMSSEKTVVNGYDVAPKTRVFINAWAIGRDPNVWKDAHKFYPERFIDSSIDFKGIDFELIPFGAGKRICPGITFGTVNMEFLLANLLYHFDWKFPQGVTAENLDINDISAGTVKRKVDSAFIPIPIHRKVDLTLIPIPIHP